MMNHPTESLISRDDVAFVIVDIQERLAAVMDERDRVVSSAVKLIKLAALIEAPLLVTRQYPEGLGPNVPEVDGALLHAAEDGARVHSVDKLSFCCSAETSFVEAYEATGRKQVVVLGMETHICVVQTALSLHDAGYHVHVPADACCSRSAENHQIALDRMRAAGVVVTTSESVMYEAVGRAGTPEFRGLLGIVKG